LQEVNTNPIENKNNSCLSILLAFYKTKLQKILIIKKNELVKNENPNLRKTDWDLIFANCTIANLPTAYNVPLLACSLSIDSNNALKLPAPKPFAPIR
jgi:hypothetical protein